MKPIRNNWPIRKRKSPALSTLNVLASRGLGRVWCFNFNIWLLLGITGILIIYLLFSFLLVARFFGEHQQKNLLIQLEKDFQKTQKALYQAKQRLKFLENYIDPSKIPAGRSKGTQNPESALSQNKRSSNNASKGLKAPESEAKKNAILAIKDMDISHRSNSLSASFKLARRSPGRTPVRGYIFTLAVDRSTNPPRFWSSPKADLENGIPVNPKRGQAFKIRNFRRIRARWSFESAENIPSELRILVYDKSGSLLLKEDYKLNKD